MKLSFYNRSPVIFEQEYPWDGGPKQILFRVSDYVEMRLSEPIDADPLVVGKLTDRDSRLYAVGFPNRTNTFAKFGGTDSPGTGKWVSTGKLVPLPRSPLENINITASIAGALGSSGSPLFDRNGHVLGILFSGGSEVVEGELRPESQYLQLDFALLFRIWKGLNDLPKDR